MQEQVALASAIRSGKRLEPEDKMRLYGMVISADLPSYLGLCSQLGYTLQKRSIRDHLYLMRVMQVTPTGLVQASLKNVEAPIAQTKTRTPSPVRRLARRPQTLPGESPEPRKAPISTDSKSSKPSVPRVFEMSFDSPHKIYPLWTPVAGKPAPDTIQAPGYFLDNFFSHICLTDNLLEGTGHVRASHEFNAFPRTWSLEEIVRAIERVVTDRAWQTYKPSTNDKIEVDGRYKGLDIGMFCHLNDQQSETVHTAFVKDSSSAGELENREVDAANERLRQIRHPLLARIVRHHLKNEHIWSTLAVAEEVIEVSRGLTLIDADIELLSDLRRALGIGEVRHPDHRAAIESNKPTWLPWNGIPRWC